MGRALAGHGRGAQHGQGMGRVWANGCIYAYVPLHGVYMCVHGCICAYMPLHGCICVYMGVYVGICVYMVYVRTWVYMCIHASTWGVYVLCAYMFVKVCTWVHICVYMGVYVGICVYMVYKCVYVCFSMGAYLRTWVCIYICA